MRKYIFLWLCLCGLFFTRAVAEHAPEETVLFAGAASTTVENASIQHVFTAHVGGAWDAAQMNVGCAFQVSYTGPENGVYLALSSHSGARQWARLDPDAVTDLGEGRWTALFTYENILRSWGNSFARLDQLNVFSCSAQPITVNRIAYIPGEGDPVDASDGRWDKPDQGIAFIGDSICQNPLYLYGDWNALLNRSDCVNYGIGGQTTVECLARIDELCGRHYDQVVFICGINELGRGDYETGIVANFDAMIQTLKADQPGIQAVIVSVLPTTEAFYFGMQSRIVRLNAILEQYASQTENVTFVNCYDDFVDTERGYAKPELLTDGLHPNADGYAIIAERLSGVLVPERD